MRFDAPRLLISSESFREKSPDAVGTSSASRSPGVSASSASSRARSRSKSPKLPNPPGASPRAAAGKRRARATGRGAPGAGGRWRRARPRARGPATRARPFRAVERGRAPPAAHFAFAPAFAPSANIETPRRTEWPRGGVGRHRGIFDWPAVVCCELPSASSENFSREIFARRSSSVFLSGSNLESIGRYK